MCNGIRSYTSTSSVNDTMSCSEAESGVDDDLGIAGTDSSALDACVCTVEGAVDYCAAEHTSTDLATLKECTESADGLTYYENSNNIAMAANDGSPLWIRIDGTDYSFSTNETHDGLAAWATGVFAVTCQALVVNGLTIPASCDSLLY